MSFLVIINGSLGSGKTTNAKELAKKLKAKYFELDKILEKNNLDELATNTAEIPAKNFIKALDFIIPEVNKILQQGKVVIIDGCFYHQRVLNHLTKNIKYKKYIFTLKTPLAICIKRDKLRKKTLGEEAARAVYKLVTKNKFGIIITSGGSLKETQKKIISYLPINNK